MVLWLESESCWPKISEKCYNFWFISIFPIKSLKNYRFDFFKKVLNWKPHFCRRELAWTNKDSSILSQKSEHFFDFLKKGVRSIILFRKYFVWNLSFCDTHIDRKPNSAIRALLPWSWNSFLSKNTGFISCLQTKIVHLENCSKKNSAISSLVCNTDSSKIRKSAKFFKLFDYSKLYFLLHTSLICSITFSVDSFNKWRPMQLKFHQIFSWPWNVVIRIFQNVLLLLICLNTQTHISRAKSGFLSSNNVSIDSS